MEDDDASRFLSSLETDFSSGYLEDALLEFSDHYKRRRLLLYTDDLPPIPNENLFQSIWELPSSFNYSSHGCSDEQLLSTSISSISEEGTGFPRMEAQEEVVSAMDSIPTLKMKNSVINEVKATLFEDSPPTIDCQKQQKNGSKRRITRVVYPFDMVKPGGREGDVTLNDINERILMPPSRPVRHPVGDFACRPYVSPHGTGLSGKAVVAITRIHTRGRGTIRIIRTKG